MSFTRDFGATWANATGVKSVGIQGNFWFAKPLAVEKQLPENASEAVFYYYNGTTTLFTSTDSGASFVPTYTGFPTWNVPLFGLATPPRGTSAMGDLWAFAGWKLYHSTDGGHSFSGVWSVYGMDHVVTVGRLPAMSGGGNATELASRCAAQAAAAAAAANRPSLPLPRAGTGYVVYIVGVRNYGEPAALFGSVDYGHSWIPLAGPNSSTPQQGLGDSPYERTMKKK